MDTYTLFALTNEIKDKILFKRINKIFQNENNLFIFKLSSNENLILDLSHFFLSNIKLKNRATPPAFCMLLRKYINSAFITELKHFRFYRILEIKLKKGNENYSLLINFSNKRKNLILKHNNSVVANLSKFTLPEIKEIDKLSLNDFKEALLTSKIEGFPPFVVKELIFFSKKYNIEYAYEKYLCFYNFNIEFTPAIIKNKLYPFIPEHLVEKDDVKVFSSFNEMLKFQFEKTVISIEKNRLKKILTNRIKRLEKTILNINKEIEDKKNYEKYFKFGELLKANLHTIKKGIQSVKVVDYFTEKMPEIEIILSPEKTPLENAEAYFKKGKKSKRGLIKLEERKNEINQEILSLKENLFFIESAENIDELQDIIETIDYNKNKQKNKIATTSPFKEFQYKNYKIVAGKSGKSNDYIIRKFGKPDYLWFHVKDFPGAHVIILEKEENLTEEVIKFAAKIALENSKAKNNGKGEVIYTKIKYLQKPKGAPPGLVTLKKFKTIFVTI